MTIWSDVYISEYIVMTTYSETALKDILNTSTSIVDFTRALVQKWCLGQPDLINYPVMRKKIRAILRDFKPESPDMEETDRYEAVDEVATDIQAILMVLRDKYVECGGRCLDPRVDEMDLAIHDLVERFFVRRGTINAIIEKPTVEESDDESEESDDESEDLRRGRRQEDEKPAGKGKSTVTVGPKGK